MVDKKSTSYPKEKINILFLENISDAAVKYFKDAGYASVRKVGGALSEEQLINEVKDVHLLGIRSKTQITPKVLDAAKKLQAIGCFCIGVNQVDLKSAKNHGVVVFNAPYSNTRSVAELVIGLAIMLIRRIPDKSIRRGGQAPVAASRSSTVPTEIPTSCTSLGSVGTNFPCRKSSPSPSPSLDAKKLDKPVPSLRMNQ